jgi:hypothetical protein
LAINDSPRAPDSVPMVIWQRFSLIVTVILATDVGGHAPFRVEGARSKKAFFGS